MRFLLLILAFLSLPVAAQTITCDNGHDGNPPNNPDFVPSRVPDTITAYRYGAKGACSGNSFDTPERAAIWSCQTNGYVTGTARWTGTYWCADCLDSNNNVHYCASSVFSNECTAQIPWGYSAFASYQSDEETQLDSLISAAGGSITRNSDGNITSAVSPATGSATWSGTTFDADKRMTGMTIPDGNAVTYTYYPGTSRVYSRTYNGNTTYYTWFDDLKPNTVVMPDGSQVQYIYQDGSTIVAALNPQSQLNMDYANEMAQVPLGDLTDPLLPVPDSIKGGCLDPTQTGQLLANNSIQWIAAKCRIAHIICGPKIYNQWGYVEPKTAAAYQSCMHSHGC